MGILRSLQHATRGLLEELKARRHIKVYPGDAHVVAAVRKAKKLGARSARDASEVIGGGNSDYEWAAFRPQWERVWRSIG